MHTPYSMKTGKYVCWLRDRFSAASAETGLKGRHLLKSKQLKKMPGCTGA
jgi:hypothetical protein